MEISKMKVGIDVSPIIYGTGVSTYLKNLLENLFATETDNKYILFGGSLRRKAELKVFFSTLQGIPFESKVVSISPTIGDILWNRLHILPIELFIGKVDVFHSSDWVQPPNKAFKVTTVHDLAPLRFPKLTHPKITAVHKRRLKWVKKEVDRVIVPSKATKEDLILYGVNKDKIRVIHEAHGNIFKPAKKYEIEKLKRKYQINGNYLLSVGVSPRKNTESIIKAFDLAKAGENLNLVLVGLPTFINVEKRRGLRLLGNIPENELSALYTGANAMVYPSIYEGFGLPILEAMACGCPVVTSNISSLPEVAGDAAVLVDPYEVRSIAEGIKKALRGRKGLIKKGFERVKKFSWQKTAEETLKLYNEAG